MRPEADKKSCRWVWKGPHRTKKVVIVSIRVLGGTRKVDARSEEVDAGSENVVVVSGKLTVESEEDI